MGGENDGEERVRREGGRGDKRNRRRKVSAGMQQSVFRCTLADQWDNTYVQYYRTQPDRVYNARSWVRQTGWPPQGLVYLNSMQGERAEPAGAGGLLEPHTPT